MRNNDFVSLSSDFGFKRFMNNKENVIDFLNSILPVQVISIDNTRKPTSAPTTRTNSANKLFESLSFDDITSKEQEEFGDLPGDKSIRYDYCTYAKQAPALKSMSKYKKEFSHTITIVQFSTRQDSYQDRDMQGKTMVSF